MGYGVQNGDGQRGPARLRSAARVLWAVLGLNALVAAAKLLCGVSIGSVSMIADGFHSLFDGASNVIGIVGSTIASRPADDDHPYGHGKYETWASFGIGILLVLAAWNVGKEALTRLLGEGTAPQVGPLAFVVMGVTICVNIGVSVYERRAGKRLRSEVLLADASHTSSDILVSLGVIGALAAVAMGVPAADPVIALLVSLAIAKTAWGVLKRAETTLSDRARLPVDEICDVACAVGGVLGCHDVRTRGSMSQVYVDMHVQVEPAKTIREAHAIAETVERIVFDHFEDVADVIVHIEPMDGYQAEKTARQMGE